MRIKYATAGTVPGTRFFHHFATDGVGLPKFEGVSDDKSFCEEHIGKNLLSASDLPMSYICCARFSMMDRNGS